LLLVLLAGVANGQDGTQGSLVREPSVFLMPPLSAINGFTLGARKKLMTPEFGHDFAYNCTNGIRDWARVLGHSACEAREQSPINITPDQMPSQPAGHSVGGRVAVREIKSAASMLQINFVDTLWVASNEFVLNMTVMNGPPPRTNGSRVPVFVPQDNVIEWGGDDDDNPRRVQYVLKRVEFHTPAEHLVQGVRFALEIQLHLESADGQRLSVASFGRVADFRHVSPDILLLSNDLLPTIPESGTTMFSVNPAAFLPRLEGFWSYTGSQTSPPCTGDIRWVVMHYPINITQEFLSQIQGFVNIRYFGGNTREVQERDVGYPVDLYVGGGEILFMTPFGLTDDQLNVTIRTGHVAWGPESTVVSMARQWVITHPYPVLDTEVAMAPFGDDWAVLLLGHPLSVDPINFDWYSNMDSDSSLALSMASTQYHLKQTCDPEYTWNHRFLNPYTHGVPQVEASSVFDPPAIAPGSHLLQFPRKAMDAQIQVSPVLKEVREQFVKPTDAEVLRVLPDDHALAFRTDEFFNANDGYGFGDGYGYNQQVIGWNDLFGDAERASKNSK